MHQALSFVNRLRVKYFETTENSAGNTVRLIFNPATRRYEFVGGFESRHIPKKARFAWDPERKCWFTESHKTAVALLQYADEPTKAQLVYLLTH